MNIAIVSMAVVGSLGATPIVRAQAQVPDEPSPESGTAQVVAQGVVDISANDVKWRITDRTALPPVNAEPIVGDLGFVTVNAGVMLVEDRDTGDQQRLAAGEAMLTLAGATQSRVALGSDTVAYRDLALVDAAAADADKGTVIFASEPFAGPADRHDLDLLQDALAPGAVMTIPGGSLPTLVLVDVGSANVSTDAGDVLSLGEGEAASLPGPLSLTAAEAGAVVTAVYAGPAVPRLTQAAGTPIAGRVVETTTRRAAVTPVASPSASTATNQNAADNPDEDADGLTLSEETAAGTDPELADTDEDGLTDGQEIRDYRTNPLLPDTDGDGVLDGDEVALGSDPNDATAVAGEAAPESTNQDIAVEATAVPPETSTPGDSDGDGLDDTIENDLGTDPADPDTDDDGLSDGAEYYTYATGTRNPDSDGDGVVDGVEIENGTDPNNAASS